MGFTVGLPSMKLNNVIRRHKKHCGNFLKVAQEALQERNCIDIDIRPELSYLNQYLTEIHSASELKAYSDNWIRSYNDSVDIQNESIRKQIEEAVAHYNEGSEQPLTKGQALREINSERQAQGLPMLRIQRHISKNAVVMCATIIKVPMEYMEQLSTEQQRNILLDGFEKMKDIVGEHNIKAAVIHFDEATPHIHIFWQPVTPDGRLNGSKMHNLQFYAKLNEAMPKHLRERGWDIEPCHIYNREEEEILREELGYEAYRILLSEKRSKNGRPSGRYKYEVMRETEKAEERLAELEQQIIMQTAELARIRRDSSEAQEAYEKITEQIIMQQQTPEPPIVPKGNRPAELEEWLKENVHETNPFKRRKSEKEQTAIWQSLNKPFDDYETEFHRWREQFGIINLEKNRALMLHKRESELAQKEQMLTEEKQKITDLQNNLSQYINNEVDKIVNRIVAVLPQELKELALDARERDLDELQSNPEVSKQSKKAHNPHKTQGKIER